MSRQKIHLLFTGLGAGNIGDEAMFLAFLDHYYLPAGSTVEVWDPSSPVINTFPRQYRYVDWKDDLNNNQSVKSSRAALLVGGTPVAAEWGIDWPLRALADRLRFCHAEGIPVHAVGVGVDSLYGEEARQIFIDAFRPITSWTVRTFDCRSALLDLGVPSEKIVVGADLAWLFSPNVADKQWAYDLWKSLGVDMSKPLLGVNAVNERWSGPTYVKKAIADALDRLIREMGMQVAFLCNETREGDYFDACAAREVSGIMKEDAVLVPNEYFTPSQMVALLSFCTITLSQRYHFTVLSILAAAVPISFARGQKMISLLKDMGEEPVGTMEACDPEYLGDQIRHVLSNKSDIRARQQLSAKDLRERAKDNFMFINAMRPKFTSPPRLAALSELNSDRFKEFMEMLNNKARAWGLREFTNWSKVWEYPWLWFNGLRSIDWSQIKMLDLGSELSPMPWFLASLGAAVTLVERDSQWLPTWERLAKETGLNVDWCIINDERLPFPARSFDVVTSFSVVEHQRDKSLAINDIARVLKPGGIFAVSFDICEPDMGMTFPEWNGKALTMKEFEELVWENPAFDNAGKRPDWNIGDCAEFIKWHQQSASHHNYVVGAALIQRRAEKPLKPDRIDIRACRNILMPRFDTFGDIVLLQGFIQALLDLLPEARITLLVREGYDQLASLFPQHLIWKTTRIHPYKKPSNIVEIKSLISELEKDSYDLILTTAYNRTWLDDVIAATLTSSWRIVLGEAHEMPDNLKEIVPDLDIKFSYDLYDECISVEERCHETEKYQTLWKNITGKVEPISRPKLVVPDDESKKAQEFLAKAGMAEGKFVFCFPAGVSNVSLKAWPENNFAEVITHLEKKYSLRTLVAGHELEKEIIEQVVELARKHGATPDTWLGKDGDIPLACALIAKCYLYLGNDTGMMHMASALDKPVVAIFGGGTWPRFLPDNQISFALTQELPCTYCMWYPCFFGDAPCIKMVEVDDVINSIEKLLEGKVNSLEVHKGLPVNSVVNALLDKAIEAFTTIRRDRDKAVTDIHKRDALLAESREVYHQAIEEIRKRDEVNHQIVEEIRKRDDLLAESHEVYHQAIEEIRKRDAWLAESREVHTHALSFLPLVSIVTPVFNRAKWIESCIQSVQNQDYPKIEHIIVDGGSTDETIDICQRYPHLILDSQKDRGQSPAINKGFAMAQGEILAWLCADDEYEPGAISAAVKGIMAGHEVVTGLSRFIDADGNVTADHPANAYDHYDHAMLLRFWKYTPISQPATFWTRKMWETCGPVKEGLFFAMDYDLWLRMSQRSSFKRIDHYVAKHRISSDAKCFSDNYASRIELIKASRQYWPSWWNPRHWILYLQYVITRSPRTRHYSDAERLLNTALQHLGEKRRFSAITSFILAHLKHVTTPLMPGYLPILQRILEDGIGPLWFWRFIKRTYDKPGMEKKVTLRLINVAPQKEATIILEADSIGYRHPQFRFWGKRGNDFILLRDWGSANTYGPVNRIEGASDYGVHLRAGDQGDLIDQAWTKDL